MDPALPHIGAAPEVVMGVLDLLGRYPPLADAHDGEAWADLFVVDGRFVYGEQTIVGRRALSRFVADSVDGVHLCGLPSLAVTGEGKTTSVSPFMFHYAGTGVILTGYYHDIIDTTAVPYRFEVREARVVGRS